MGRRIRSIKPEVLEDEVAVALSDRAWRLWVSSWVMSDDHGNLRAYDKYLAVNVWQDASADVAEARQELIDTGLWKPYAVRSQRYVHIKGWAKHQRITNAGKSPVPGPELDDGSWDGVPSPQAIHETTNQALTAKSDQTRGESVRDTEAADQTRGDSPLARASACTRARSPAAGIGPGPGMGIGPGNGSGPGSACAREGHPGGGLRVDPPRPVAESGVFDVAPVAELANRAQDAPEDIPSTDAHPADETLQEPPPRDTAAPSGASLPDGDPPEWWAKSIATVEVALGVTVDEPAVRWLEYDASRDRKGWARNHRDAVGWLTTVLRAERARRPATLQFRRPQDIVQPEIEGSWKISEEVI